MTSERIQRRIDAFLDESEEALGRGDWERAEQRASAVLALEPGNTDAAALLVAAARGRSKDLAIAVPASPPSVLEQPTSSFAGGRYEVRRFLGEGRKKRVFLAPTRASTATWRSH